MLSETQAGFLEGLLIREKWEKYVLCVSSLSVSISLSVVFVYATLTNILHLRPHLHSSDDVLRFARFVLFDQLKVLEGALDVLDRPGRVQRFDSVVPCDSAQAQGNNNSTMKGKSLVARSFWKVPNSDSRAGHATTSTYTCTETGCTCVRYCELARAADAGLTPMCKHLLAVRLATALGLVDVGELQQRGDVDAFATELAQLTIDGMRGVAGGSGGGRGAVYGQH